MTRPRIKICGITRLEDALLAVSLGADAIGFVFWPGSPRRLATRDAAAISRALPAFATRVGVFVDQSPSEVREVVEAAGLDAVQLHGDELVADYRGVAARLIKTVSPAADEEARRAANLPADVTVLVDACDREKRGGTGRVADWRQGAALAEVRPIILAGGLTAANVAEAVAAVRPWAVDVSSGVEAAPGVKDAVKLRQFFAAVAACEGEE